VERMITNWDTSYLQGRLLALISSTNYGGRTTVSFPLTHSKVVIHSPDKYNRFFSNVTKAFSGSHKYEVVKSIWPYADVSREGGSGHGRRCLVQDEERWFLEWRSVIRYAVMGKRKGWVTSEDRLEELVSTVGLATLKCWLVEMRANTRIRWNREQILQRLVSHGEVIKKFHRKFFKIVQCVYVCRRRNNTHIKFNCPTTLPM